MNKLIIFLFIATGILILSIISVSVAPIINNILGNFTKWGKLNCRFYADSAKYANNLQDKNNYEILRNICYRENAMFGLEYSSFIIDLGLGFICAQLALLHYFKIGISFEKYTGLIGLIGGAIGFILTLVYACFSGYIFNNDIPFVDITLENPFNNCEVKLYPNGALYKIEQSSPNDKHIYVYTNDKSYKSECIKYKDLGDRQYNYDDKLFNAYYNNHNGCKQTDNPTYSTCEYAYPSPPNNYRYKIFYNRWCLSLVFAVFISILSIGLLIFGFLIFKSGEGSEGAQAVKIE